MKLVIYTHAFVPNIGGIETIVMSLAMGLTNGPGELQAETIEVTLVTPQSRGQYDDSLLPFRVVRQPNPWVLFQLLRSAEIIHLAGPAFLPLLLALTLRKAVIVEHHGFQAICPNGQFLYEPEQRPCRGYFMARQHHKCWYCNSKRGWVASYKLWLLTFPRRWLCQLASANITPTDWLGVLLQVKRGVRIFHGVTQAASSILPNRTTPALFVFQGRLVSAKGAHILLQAASRLKSRGLEFILKIIGDGPERSSLESMVTKLNLSDQVHFLGGLPQEELERVIDGATAVVMPSLSGEVFGLVAVENMARGKLLVVSNIGALVEVAGEAALTFRVGDADDLAAQLAAIIESPAMVAAFRQRAIQRCHDFFDYQTMLNNHISLYRKTLERTRKSS